MTRVAFLGTGAMGARMAARLIDAGFTVTAWNRTPDRAAPLAERGAALAETPAAAANEADVVLSMVRDDDASRSVWLDAETGALAAMPSDALGIECSTVSTPWVRELDAAFSRAGRLFVDAPLAGSRLQAEAGQLIFLAGGTPVALERAAPAFSAMGSAVHRVGEPGAGTTVKLMVNALFGGQLALMAELLGLAEEAGVDVANAVRAIVATPVCSPALEAAAAAMLAGRFAPAFPIDLVEKDFATLRRTADAFGAEVPVTGAVGRVYERASAGGHAEDNITGVVQLYRRP